MEAGDHWLVYAQVGRRDKRVILVVGMSLVWVCALKWHANALARVRDACTYA